MANVATISVNGMKCQSGVKNIEQTISEVSGVTEIKVSLEEKQARVVFDTSLITPEGIAKRIDDMGFDASLIKGPPQDDYANSMAVSTIEGKTASTGNPVDSRKVVLSIENMSCGNCVANIEGKVSSQPGVLSAKVSLEAKSGVFQITSPATPLKMLEFVNKIGNFVAHVVAIDDQAVQTGKLDIEGMTCISCEQKIQENIGKEPGVYDIIVTHKTHSAEVCFNRNLITISQICEKIEDIGSFKASPILTDSVGLRDIETLM